MRRFLLLLACLASTCGALAQTAPPSTQQEWRTQLARELPLLGHRNWILIVDAAYPLQIAPGIETIDAGSNSLAVLHAVLEEIERSNHLRPLVHLDAELPFLTEADAPGISAYRRQLDDMLTGLPVERRTHEQLLQMIAEAGSQFHVLVLKTHTPLPYSSVFLRLDCKYWPAEAEQRLRQRMAKAPH
jgi:hypothetical protein